MDRLILDGRRTSVTRPNGVTTTYAYDAASQVTSISHAKADTVLLAFSYGYDAQGNRISKTREDGSQEVYGYDTDLRLGGVIYGNGRNVLYRLDALGNRVFMSDTNPPSASESTATGFSYNSFNQLTSRSQSAPPFATTNFAYDNNGNLLSETTGTQIKSYTWDLDNRLRQVTLPGGATNLFDYDAEGLRVRKNDSTGTTAYLLDGPSVLEELSPSGSTVTSYLANPQVIDEIVSFQQTGATFWPLTDVLGTVVAATNSTGTLVSTWSYDVYGQRTQTSGTLALNYGHAGREHDIDTGYIYHRDRTRNPGTGGWLQGDRMRLAAGPNYYLYAGARPVFFADPSGRFSTTLHNQLISTAFSGYLSATDIGTLEQASLDVDDPLFGGQSAANSFMHAMRAPWQSVDQASSLYQAFLAEKLIAAATLEARNTLSLTCTNDSIWGHRAAIYELGLGLHALMDSFSPWHEGFQVWYGLLPTFGSIGIWAGEDLAHSQTEAQYVPPAAYFTEITFAMVSYWEQFNNFAILARLVGPAALNGIAAYSAPIACGVGPCQ